MIFCSLFASNWKITESFLLHNNEKRQSHLILINENSKWECRLQSGNTYTAILRHRSNFAVRHRPITVSHSEKEKHKLLIHNKQAWEFHQKQCVPWVRHSPLSNQCLKLLVSYGYKCVCVYFTGAAHASILLNVVCLTCRTVLGTLMYHFTI